MEKHERLTQKLKQRDFKLNALLDITQAINANLSVPELLAQYEKILREQLSIGKLVLFTRDEKWRCLLQFGMENAVIPDVTDESFFSTEKQIRLQTSKARETFDLVLPIHQDDRPIAYLLVGDMAENEIRMSPVIKHMRFIETLTNVLVVAIENKKLLLENVRQERVKKELELAAEMQDILLQHHLPKNESYDVGAVYKAHQQVGGDYYDFLELNDEEVMFCMADVSGKGVSAAFLMASFQAYLRAIFAYHRTDLADIVSELNDRVMSSAKGEKYITLFIATYNKNTRVLEYINCGHNPPVVADEIGYTQLLKLGTIGLGMFDTLPKLVKGKITLGPRTTIVCYTDGLVEMEDERCEQFGVEQLEKLVLAFPDAKADHLNEIILKSLDEFRGEMPFIDDLAVLTCRFF